MVALASRDRLSIAADWGRRLDLLHEWEAGVSQRRADDAALCGLLDGDVTLLRAFIPVVQGFSIVGG